jgi:predicted RNase H-like HicB family nuclease
MKDSARYIKIVEWSEEDQCYVGSSPGLLYGGCHGEDEKEVFDELCRIVEEAVDLFRKDGKPLPPATSGRDLVKRCRRSHSDRLTGRSHGKRFSIRSAVAPTTT